MAFHDIRFPTNLSFGSIGGPERRVEIVALANGHEERNSPWVHSRRRYDAGVGLRSLDDIETLIAFFEARAGQLHAFRWKDWSDFKSCRPNGQITYEDQVIGTGDGITVAFQLAKRYRSGDQAYFRPINKPVAGTVRVGLSGDEQQEAIDYSVDLATGTITFTNPPDPGIEVTAGFEFDVPVRFDADRIRTSIASFRAGEMPEVPVVEVRQ